MTDDKFTAIKDMMSDGKPRTIREIAEGLGMDHRLGGSISRLMNTYAKYGFCTRVGYIRNERNIQTSLWRWVE